MTVHSGLPGKRDMALCAFGTVRVTTGKTLRGDGKALFGVFEDDLVLHGTSPNVRLRGIILPDDTPTSRLRKKKLVDVLVHNM